MRAKFRLTLYIAAALAAALPAAAQTARKDAGNSAQLMQQMQQLAAERTQLQAESARMKRELDEVRKERDTLKSERESNGQRLKVSEAASVRASGARQQVEDELARTKERMNELVGKFRETVTSLREAETERAGTQQQLQTKTQNLAACVDRNAQLYTINDEVLDRLEGQGFWGSVARAEPFTRIKRTQLENLADDYRARAGEAKVDPAGQVAPVN
jgi:chromosome segregation ATPase